MDLIYVLLLSSLGLNIILVAYLFIYVTEIEPKLNGWELDKKDLTK